MLMIMIIVMVVSRPIVQILMLLMMVMVVMVLMMVVVSRQIEQVKSFLLRFSMMINDLDMVMIVLIEESLLTTSRAALRVYMVDWTVSFGQCTVHIVHCTLSNVHCTLYIVHCTLSIVQCTKSTFCTRRALALPKIFACSCGRRQKRRQKEPRTR